MLLRADVNLFKVIGFLSGTKNVLYLSMRNFKPQKLLPSFLMIISLTAVILFTPRSNAEVIEKPHFYQVSKGSEVHYLLGTYHLAIHWEDFPKKVHKFFESQDSVILETQYDKKHRHILTISTDSMFPATTTLPDNYKDKLRKLGISDKLFPASIDDSCFMLLQYPFVGKYPFYLLDADIFFHAKDNGKKTFYLDTTEILENSKTAKRSPPNACTVGSLLGAFSAEQILAIGKKGFVAYKNGPTDYPSDDDPSVAYRNQAWMPKILEVFQNNRSFLAVGARHLYGNTGLIKLLQDQGYQVRIIKN